MRKLNLTAGVDLGMGRYTVLALLREFIFSADWSQDESTVATFDRLTAAIAADKPIEEKDFTVLCNRLKAIQFPAQASIELGHLRNDLVLNTPKVDG